MTRIDTSRGTITLRMAGAADVRAFRDIRLEGLRDAPAAFGSDYATQVLYPMAFWEERLRISGQEGAYFFAAHAGAVIGLCGIMRGRPPKTSHTATIISVYVRQDWRGLHIAEAMIEQCVGWAREHGVTILKLGVVTSNAAALACYTRCGFSIYGTEPSALLVDGVYYDEALMARRLEP